VDRGEERKSLDVIVVIVGEEEVDLAWSAGALPDEALSKIADAGPGVEDDPALR
jgi:hypothetical protein